MYYFFAAKVLKKLKQQYKLLYNKNDELAEFIPAKWIAVTLMTIIMTCLIDSVFLPWEYFLITVLVLS
jgi:hypothetical protein